MDGIVCKKVKTAVNLKVIRPFKKEIENGISEELLNRSIAIGFTGGIFPVPGLTLVCSFILQYLFRGSFIICQSMNVIVTPLHFLSLKIFYQFGMNYILPSSYTMSIETLMDILLKSSIKNIVTTFFAYIVGAVVIWFLLSPILLVVSYFVFKPISRFLLRKFKYMRSQQSKDKVGDLSSNTEKFV